jgi:hypothetical protein
MRMSVAIMHHPARSGRLPKLLDSCAALSPRVVTDPDPDGPPSPLRTAKRAWAAIAPGATHHLVLQDDIELMPAFPENLLAAVGQQPTTGITLYVNWHSTPNAYYVRRAAVTGAPWTPLCPSWTPTLGLVLPTEHARALAAHLATIPDDVRHDDVVITDFCRDRSIRVVAAVPHLLDHPGTASLAGNETDGDRHATVFAGDGTTAPPHWSTRRAVVSALAARATVTAWNDYSVEMHNSECRIRFTRPSGAEAPVHPFGWYWYDWCHLVGVDREALMDDCEAFLRTRRARTGTAPLRISSEIWAAGYLLGADAATVAPGQRPGTAADQRPALVSDAVASWIDSGLSPPDARRLDGSTRAALVGLGTAAVRAGLESAGARTGAAPHPGPTVGHGLRRAPDTAVADLVRRMARREAACHLLAAQTDMVVRVQARWLPCPWCGAGEVTAAARPWILPLRGWEAGYDWAPPSDGQPVVLTMLGCERVTARALLPLAAAVKRFDELRGVLFWTRAATAASTVAMATAAMATAATAVPAGVGDLLSHLDAAERWVDALLVGARPPVPCDDHLGPPELTLPASARSVHAGASDWARAGSAPMSTWEPHRRFMNPHFVTPHCDSGDWPGLNDIYLKARLHAVTQGMRRSEPASSRAG